MIGNSPQVTCRCVRIDLGKWTSQNSKKSLLRQIIRERLIASNRAQIPPHSSLVFGYEFRCIKGLVCIR